MKNYENGRSMVEMLGVLAIIGVLSAGALKGYSAAMFRHKVNQTIDIFQGVLQRLTELEQQNLGEDFYIYTSEKMLQYGLLDKCQETAGIIDSKNDTACQLPIGTLEIDVSNYDGKYLAGQIFLHFTDSKSCIAFSSAGWENAIPIEWMGVGGYTAISGTPIYDPFGNAGEVIKSTTMSNLTQEYACDSYCENGGCYFQIYIREY